MHLNSLRESSEHMSIKHLFTFVANLFQLIVEDTVWYLS